MVRLAGSTFAIVRRTPVKGALRLEAVLPRRGVAAIWITLKPRTLELTPSQIQEYLNEIGAPDSIRALYPPTGPNPRWRETYVKQAKTFITVGKLLADTSWKVPVGTSFEIVPGTDPRTIESGDTVEFQLLRNGLPFGNFPVGSVGDGTPPILRRTDVDGRVRFPAS